MAVLHAMIIHTALLESYNRGAKHSRPEHLEDIQHDWKCRLSSDFCEIKIFPIKSRLIFSSPMFRRYYCRAALLSATGKVEVSLLQPLKFGDG